MTTRTKIQDLPRTKVIKIEENQYEVKFPNMGQIIEIEAKKVAISLDKYSAMINNPTVGTNLALDFIEAISYISVLIPQLTKDLKVNSLFELDMISSVVITNCYKYEILPWYLDWIEALQEEDKERKKQVEALNLGFNKNNEDSKED